MSDTEVTGTALSEALREVLIGHLRSVPPEVDWSTVQLRDLGLDSMTAIELVLDIEDRFDAQFPEEVLVRETFATFGSLETVVRSMVEPA